MGASNDVLLLNNVFKNSIQEKVLLFNGGPSMFFNENSFDINRPFEAQNISNFFFHVRNIWWLVVATSVIFSSKSFKVSQMEMTYGREATKTTKSAFWRQKQWVDMSGSKLIFWVLGWILCSLHSPSFTRYPL